MEKVLITGCSSGFGLETALLLAQEGFEVIATIRPSSSQTALKQALFEKKLTNLHIEYLDVLDALYHPQVLEALEKKYQGFDIVICNAGILYAHEVENYQIEEIIQLVQTNLTAVMAMISKLVKRMKEQGCGKIIFLSSLAARRPLPYLSCYNATKTGIEGFAKSLYLELASDHIQVYLVEPGFYQTKLWHRQAEVCKKISQKKMKTRDVKEVSFQILKICLGKTKRFHHVFGLFSKIQCLCKPLIYTKMGKMGYCFYRKHFG